MMLPSNAVEALWPPQALRGAFKRAKGLYTEPKVLRRIQRDKWQFWAGFRREELEFVFLTALDQMDSGGLVCYVTLGGGKNGKEWAELMAPDVFAWASANEATEVRVEGRKGWAKVLKGLGFRQDRVLLKRELP
jgi:hypothetical protein